MLPEKIDLGAFAWLNRPDQVETTGDGVEFVTRPDTDFWQRTHYGFRRDNGHALLAPLWPDFSFAVDVEFFYETLFDQAGLLIHIDQDNWAKASIEYEDEAVGALGSVVTNMGWSDWAVSSIPTDINRMTYRVSRRDQDFFFECATDGDGFRPLRVFHLHGDLAKARVGIYACSPSDSSFRVRFSRFEITPSIWKK